MKISNKIHAQTSLWLSSMFFSDSLATFLPSNTESLAKILRLALANKFDNYLSEGYFGMKPVSIYINCSNPYLPDLKFAVHAISLPQNCIRIISCASGFLEAAELEKQIENDKANEATPLVLFADFGSSLNGDVDGSLEDLSAISVSHRMWLHISGPHISSFALAQNQYEITKHANSMTVELDCWLGLPTILPTILLYKPFPALNQSAFEIENDMRKIDSFPIWVVLQNTGRERVIEAIAQAFQSCEFMHDLVSKSKGYKLLSKASPASDEDKKSVVLFQFDGSAEGSDGNSSIKANGNDLNALYYSRLNSWLYQTLERDFPQVQLSLLEHPKFGCCIRYSPFELSMGEKVEL